MATEMAGHYQEFQDGQVSDLAIFVIGDRPREATIPSLYQHLSS
jgi:hypothetical protein